MSLSFSSTSSSSDLNLRSSPGKASSRAKFVYGFGNGAAEGDGSQKNLLGGKGANLHEMTKMGLPVPAGFTISTEVCNHYYAQERTFPPFLKDQVVEALQGVEKLMGQKFGDPRNPLLVSVRSGARASMPGMMDTILNLGLNPEVVEGLAERTNNARFAYDSYRRFVSMYGEVVLGVSATLFDEALERRKEIRGVEADLELNAEDWKALVHEYRAMILETTGSPFPDNPMEQLWGAIGAVFGSWMTPRAITYRKLHQIPESWGTAVNVQSMVFGNMGQDGATGVAFTRDPSTGERKFYGEYLVNAQGEDVVAGIRTPQPINEASKNDANRHSVTLEQQMPSVYRELVRIYGVLEAHYRDMQDIEFTVQGGKLFMLQCRSGKRTAEAAIRIASDMVKEGLISKEEAVLRVHPGQLDQLLHPRLDPKAPKTLLAKGLPASPGAACGQIVFDPDVAAHWVKDLSRKVILVRAETSPEDIHGMSVAEGILTARGGMTSHAAVVARGMGKCCVAGCSALKLVPQQKQALLGERILQEGDWITLDGATGEIFLGTVPTVVKAENELFNAFMTWVDEFRKMGVRANADTPLDAQVARHFGAQGIGLCRTEHMFFEPSRIEAVREMILSESKEGRCKALDRILPMQREDFEGIFRAMAGLPVTIRLLDPPLHEFLPHGEVEIQALSQRMGVSLDRLHRKIESLKEFNPMLGHRGCRLAISYPEIYQVQVRAIMEAACSVAREGRGAVLPEIMIPLAMDAQELGVLTDLVEQECQRVQKESGINQSYRIGTMIELPRAALMADRLATHATFFSFGTNDLTQTTMGLSRDDAGTFLPTYVERKIFEQDPFVSLDRDGVGALMAIAVEKGRRTRPDIKLGICGEHGGDPSSIEFCHKLGLDYVSCSPYRVPIARLAAAQAELTAKRGV